MKLYELNKTQIINDSIENDFDFFSKAKKLGMKSVWLDDAIIFETITSDRRKLKYISKI